MGTAIKEAGKKIIQNKRLNRRTLLVCFYAGHGAKRDNTTWALINSNESKSRGYSVTEILTRDGARGFSSEAETYDVPRNEF